jgi:hypothetical protein
VARSFRNLNSVRSRAACNGRLSMRTGSLRWLHLAARPSSNRHTSSHWYTAQGLPSNHRLVVLAASIRPYPVALYMFVCDEIESGANICGRYYLRVHASNSAGASKAAILDDETPLVAVRMSAPTEPTRPIIKHVSAPHCWVQPCIHTHIVAIRHAKQQE